MVVGKAVNPSATSDAVLCLNCGSSSLKFSMFEVSQGTLKEIATGGVEGIGLAGGRSWLRVSPIETERAEPHPDHGSALTAAFRWLEATHLPTPSLVGHRVVHGGAAYRGPTLIDAHVVEGLVEVVPLAPLHMPSAIEGIRAVWKQLPGVPQVACFDTSFHASMPEHVRRLPIPRRFDARGVRRYGFHGISYESIMETLGAGAPSRIVIAHLGNGSSLVAVKDGKAIDTTMGFTPTGGIMMGTRCGDLDPGVFVYMLRDAGVTGDTLERIVDRESGLEAIGGTSDMKTLVERASADADAQLATTMFAYAVRKAIGSLAAALGGIDLLVFTGGIGEHLASVRLEVCEGLAFLGIEIDVDRNRRNDDIVTTAASPCRVRVIPTQEDRTVARRAIELVRNHLARPT